MIPIPTLEVLCEAAKKSLYSASEAVLIPMIDARRMEVYTQAYPQPLPKGKGAVAVVVENEESLFSPSLLGEGRGEASYFYFGDGAEKCAKIFTKPNWHYVPNIVPEAQFMGALAEKIINHKSQITNHQSIDLAYYEPFYLKEFIAAPSHVKGLN